MKQIDFKEHNRESKKIWDAFNKGAPIKVPVIAGTSDRFFVQNPNTNPQKVSFREYTENPDLMFEMQANFDRYKRFNVLGDHMMGYPEEDEGGWHVNIDFENYFDAGWFGAKIEFPHDAVPYAVPLLDDDNRQMLFDKGIPDPFSGLMARGREYYERFMELKKTFLLDGYPVSHIQMNWLGTDGPFTIACELLGPANMCIYLCEEPEYVHQLMEFITESLIMRTKAWRLYLGQPEIQPYFFLADDSILLISTEMYKEFVLPYHKKLLSSLTTADPDITLHLCGDATRHFKTILDNLNVSFFDTGFPVSHGSLVRELGSNVTIAGGPKAELVHSGTPAQIIAESERILQEVMPYTKRFILREGNDIPPYTPLENIAALTEARNLFGIYRKD